MRIAMFTNNYKPFVGGVPVSVDRLASGLRNRGHVVDIFAPSYKNQVDEAGVLRFKSFKKSLKGGFVVPDMFDKGIRVQFKRGNYDIIHCHQPMLMGYTALYLSRKYNVPLVHTYHTRYVEYLHYVMPRALNKDKKEKAFYKAAEWVVTEQTRSFANACDLIFAPTPEVKDLLHNNSIYRPVAVLPTGLSTEDFVKDEAESRNIRDRYNTSRLFCSVSRLENEKNYDFMIRGLAKLKEQWELDFKVLIIGEGTEKQSLIAQAKQLGLENEIVFLGYIEHEKLIHYYNACDMFLFTSQSETQGIVLLEAMAAGLPVVAVEGSGINDIVDNGFNGFTTALDEACWADKIQASIANPLRYEALRKGAYKTACGYTSEMIAKLAEHHYTTCLQEQPQYASLKYKIN